MKKHQETAEIPADGRCPDCGEALIADGTYLHYQRSLGERYNGQAMKTEDL